MHIRLHRQSLSRASHAGDAECTWQLGRLLSVTELQVAQRQAVTERCVMDSMRCCASSLHCSVPSSASSRSASSSSIAALYLLMHAASAFRFA